VYPGEHVQQSVGKVTPGVDVVVEEGALVVVVDGGLVGADGALVVVDVIATQAHRSPLGAVNFPACHQ